MDAIPKQIAAGPLGAEMSVTDFDSASAEPDLLTFLGVFSPSEVLALEQALQQQSSSTTETTAAPRLAQS